MFRNDVVVIPCSLPPLAVRRPSREWRKEVPVEFCGLSCLREDSRLGASQACPSTRPSSQYVSSVPLPLASTLPRYCNSNWALRCSSCAVVSLTCTRPATPVLSIRLAVFTVSPNN